MRTFYYVLVVAVALAALYPYAPDGGGNLSLVDRLIGVPVGIRSGLGLALPFLLMGVFGQATLPPMWGTVPRMVVGLILAAVVAVAIGVGAHVMGQPVSGALFWQLPAALLGILLWLLPPLRLRLEMGWMDGAPAAAMLLAVWLLYRLYPYEFNFDPVSVEQNLKPLIRFFVFSLTDYVRETAVWLVVAMMLSRLGPERFSSFTLLMFGVAVLAVEAHVDGNQITVTDGGALLTAFLLHGFLLGWLPGRGAIYGLVLLAALAFASVWPLTMRVEPVGIVWRPFSVLLAGSEENATPLLMLWIFVFASLVWLFREAGFGSLGATAVAVVALCGLEAAHLFIDGRAPDPAGPLVALLAGIALAGLRRRPWRTWRPIEPEEAIGRAEPAGAVAAAMAAGPMLYDNETSDEALQSVATAGDDPAPESQSQDDWVEEDASGDDGLEYEETPASAPSWSLESGGGGELLHDDGGTTTGGSASGYVPEEIVEEEFEEADRYTGAMEWDQGDEPLDALDEETVLLDDEPAAGVPETEVAYGVEVEEALPVVAEAEPLSVIDVVTAAVRLVVGVAVVGGLLIALRQVPTVSDHLPPFMRDASALSMVLLGFIMLLCALGATAIGRFSATTRIPLLTLPLLSGLAGIIFVFLLDVTLGDAWLMGLIGMPNVYHSIIASGFGNDIGRSLIGLVSNKKAFDGIELLLRGSAAFVLLFLPMAAFVAVFIRMADYPEIRGGRRLLLGGIVLAVFIGSALPWLVVAKLMLFDAPVRGGLVAETDAGIGAYILLLLLLLWGWNAALLGRPLGRPLWGQVIGRSLATAVALPIGFVLAAFAFRTGHDGHGLATMIAIDGADEWQIALVWSALQLVCVAIFAYGCRILPAQRPAGADDEPVSEAGN